MSEAYIYDDGVDMYTMTSNGLWELEHDNMDVSLFFDIYGETTDFIKYIYC